MALDLKSFAIGKANGGGGGGITVEKLTATENGTYTAESGKAFNPVVVDVPEPTGSIEITENGTYDVTEVASAEVNVVGRNPYEVSDAISNHSIVYYKSTTTGCCPIFAGDNAPDKIFLDLKFVSFRNAKSFSSFHTAAFSRDFMTSANLVYANLGITNLLSEYMFSSNLLLKLVILRVNSVATLKKINAFNACASIQSVYVPDLDESGNNLPSQYKTATNWSTYASLIKGFSEAPTYDDTTTYEIGDVCQYNGKFYGYCKEDLTSSIGNAPTGTNEDNAYWEYVDDIVTE